MALDSIKREVNKQRSNSFYQHHYHRVIMMLMFVFAFTVGSVLFLFYQFTHRPLPVFKAVMSDSQQMKLTAYDKPNLLPETIIRWANKAATAAYTFDFVNYQNQINLARPYFTDAGWQDYNNSIESVISTVVQNQIFVNGIVSGPSVVSNEGELPGRGYVWRVQIPFLVTYQAAENISKKRYFVIITLVEIPTSVNPQGIGIDQFQMVAG